MAHIIKESTTLQKQAKTEKIKLLIYWVIALASFLIAYTYIDQNSFIYLVPVIVVAIVIRLSWKTLIIIRGNMGEQRVIKVLKELPEGYNILNDVIINVGDKEAQIDHLVVSPFGLWSIETKSHLGRIYGKENDKNWTQKKKSEKGKIYTKSFYNPVMQNAVHCRRLKDYIKEKLGKELDIKSVIVFTSADQLNIQTVTPVVTPKYLNKTILESDTYEIMDTNNVNSIIEVLMTV